MKELDYALCKGSLGAIKWRTAKFKNPDFYYPCDIFLHTNPYNFSAPFYSEDVIED